METKLIHCQDITLNGEPCDFTNASYQFTSCDVEAIAVVRQMIIEFSTITGMTLTYEGQLNLFDEEGKECNIQYTRMLVNDTQVLLVGQEKCGNQYEILTKY
jgi:hypothetical protein